MTIEELNKLIKEELDAFFEAEDEEVEDMEVPEGDGDDDIEVTTDEPDADTGEEALNLLRQIYDMIKPEIEPEGEEEPEMDMEEPEGEEVEGDEAEEEGGDEEEAVDEAVDNHTFFRGDNVGRTNVQAKDVQGTREKMNESFDGAARFKKLANIKG
jgi:hypothetical protein